MNYKSECLVCGTDLVYHKNSIEKSCIICDEVSLTKANCSSGHYICDECHCSSANDWIEKYCLSTQEKDSVAIANFLMKSPLIKMHGPEHHFLVPAVLLTSYCNAQNDYKNKINVLKLARERAEKILGGFCGFWGTCGAAIGTGIFVSIITGTTPVSKSGWQLSNLMTSTSLQTIANHGGPRCCKRNTFLAILEASKYVREKLDISLEVSQPIRCEYTHLNKECLTEGCPFHTKV